jgi:hypothetical protein
MDKVERFRVKRAIFPIPGVGIFCAFLTVMSDASHFSKQVTFSNGDWKGVEKIVSY